MGAGSKGETKGVGCIGEMAPGVGITGGEAPNGDVGRPECGDEGEGPELGSRGGCGCRYGGKGELVAGAYAGLW